MENKKNSIKSKEIINKKSFPKKREYKENIENNPYVQNWLSSYPNSTEYQRNVKLTLIEKFCKFTEKDPTTLVLEHRNDIMRENPLDIENIGKKQLLSFFDYLKGNKITVNNINKDKFPLTSKFYETIRDKKIEKKITHNSARQYVFSKLASFFKRNNVGISFDKKDVPPHHPKGTIDKVWRNGKEERIEESNRVECLKQIRDTFPHLRDKAIFLSKLSSGLDDIDLFQLKVSDFKKGIMGEFDICYLEGNRKKTQMYYQTFLNSESVRMIELYLKERKNKDSESWLFVNIKDNSKQCKFNTFSESLKVICRKLDIKNITPKSLRRYFNTILKRNKIDFEIIERLLGHKVEISKGSAYDEILSDSYKLAKFYSEKIEAITFLGNGNQKISKVDKRVEQLENLNKSLVTELDKTNEKLDDLSETIGFMSKFMLSLDLSFKEVVDDNYVPKKDDDILFSFEEMKEFREKIKLFLKKE